MSSGAGSAEAELASLRRALVVLQDELERNQREADAEMQELKGELHAAYDAVDDAEAEAAQWKALHQSDRAIRSSENERTDPARRGTVMAVECLGKGAASVLAVRYYWRWRQLCHERALWRRVAAEGKRRHREQLCLFSETMLAQDHHRLQLSFCQWRWWLKFRRQQQSKPEQKPPALVGEESGPVESSSSSSEPPSPVIPLSEVQDLLRQSADLRVENEKLLLQIKGGKGDGEQGAGEEDDETANSGA